jgi:hypothetical protein
MNGQLTKRGFIVRQGERGMTGDAHCTGKVEIRQNLSLFSSVLVCQHPLRSSADLCYSAVKEP